MAADPISGGTAASTPSRSPSPATGTTSTTKSSTKSQKPSKKKSNGKPKKKKLKKSYISKKTRKWERRWITKKVLGGYQMKVLAWVSSDKPAMSTVKEAPIIGRSYTCLKCQKSFQDNSGLRKHMRIHGEKTFKCTWEGCDKRFIDNSKLKRHMLVHTGEKRFVCPYDNCNKRFSLDFNLKSHMKRHARDRKFPSAKKKTAAAPSPAPSPTSARPAQNSSASAVPDIKTAPSTNGFVATQATEFVMMQTQVLPPEGKAFSIPQRAPSGQFHQAASLASLYNQSASTAARPPVPAAPSAAKQQKK